MHVSSLVQCAVAVNSPNVLVWTCSESGAVQLTAEVCDRLLAVVGAAGARVVDHWNGYGRNTFSMRIAAPLTLAQCMEITEAVVRLDIRGQFVRTK